MRAIHVCVIGTGYVGLVTGACLAELGHHVVCIDNDEAKITRLGSGAVPIYEPGLEPLVMRNRSTGHLTFTTDLPGALRASEVVFICVGTPPHANGEVDLSQVESVVRSIGRSLEAGYKVIVNKSTVPVGSGDWVSRLIREALEERRSQRVLVPMGGPATDFTAHEPMPDYDVVSSPEFLREGSAIHDMLHPDRIVLGSTSERALAVMRELYRPILEQQIEGASSDGGQIPLIETDLPSAEMIKYAANAFLATKISFINEIANICERVGADIASVARGIGQDRRIGPLFLNAGLGWGGSCFHKDLSALTHMARDYGYEARLLVATQDVNRYQRLLIVQKLQERLKVLKGKTIGLLGLAFKPDTDDVRDAPALTIAERLLALGVRVTGYDPAAGQNAQRMVPELIVQPTVRSMASGADALVLITEWPEFRELDFRALRDVMNCPLLVDGRNYLDAATLDRSGFEYVTLGR
jgi:UDPglucose 6-dehydrogenase